MWDELTETMSKKNAVEAIKSEDCDVVGEMKRCYRCYNLIWCAPSLLLLSVTACAHNDAPVVNE